MVAGDDAEQGGDHQHLGLLCALEVTGVMLVSSPGHRISIMYRGWCNAGDADKQCLHAGRELDLGVIEPRPSRLVPKDFTKRV